MRLDRSVIAEGIPQSSRGAAGGAQNTAGAPAYGDSFLAAGLDQELSGGALRGLKSDSGALKKSGTKKHARILDKIIGPKDDYPRQLMPGAEVELSTVVGGLEERIDYFSQTYQKVCDYSASQRNRPLTQVTSHSSS